MPGYKAQVFATPSQLRWAKKEQDRLRQRYQDVYASAVARDNSRVFAAGGRGGPLVTFDPARRRYDPASGTWTDGGPPGTLRDN